MIIYIFYPLATLQLALLINLRQQVRHVSAALHMFPFGDDGHIKFKIKMAHLKNFKKLSFSEPDKNIKIQKVH